MKLVATKFFSQYAVLYSPLRSSVGLHAFLPANLSVLSGGTIILQIICHYLYYFTIVKIYTSVGCMDAPLKTCMHYWPRYHVHNLSLPEYNTDSYLR